MELEMRRLLSGYVVNDPGDAPLDSAIGPGETADGKITLRSAIEQVNIDKGGSITFNGAMNIAVNSALDPITAAGVTIDGGTPGSVVISGASGYNGLVIKGGGATIQNLVVGSFLVGITLQSSQNTIQDDYIGTDATGSVAAGNVTGGIEDTGGNNTIRANVVSGNMGTGIILDGASHDQVVGNNIGTDVTGTKPLGNGIWGLEIDNGASNNSIGGPTSNTRNFIDYSGVGISGVGTTGNLLIGNTISSSGYGVNISQGASNNTIGGISAGNAISSNILSDAAVVEIAGTGTSGNLVEGNAIDGGYDGVLIVSGASDNTIGGTISGAGNFIYDNYADGVFVGSSPADNCVGDSILENSIDPNPSGQTFVGRLGITGYNLLPYLPVLSSAVDTKDGAVQINGSLSAKPDTTYRVEFFGNTDSTASGYGPGDDFITFDNLTTDASGLASFTVQEPYPLAFPPTPYVSVTATATDPAGTTSGFSLATYVAPPPPPPATYLVNDPGDEPLDPNFGDGLTSSGTITLRSAIEQVNIDDISGESIGFAFPMDISVNSQLDAITAPGVTIDGSGPVEISGSFGYDGLVIDSSGNTIENLQIDGFNNGIDDYVGSNVIRDNVIFDNSVGIYEAPLFQFQPGGVTTYPADDQILGNTVTDNSSDGVFLYDASANVVGAPGDGNVISRNGGPGVEVLGGGDNLVQANFIGTDVTGTLDLGNGGDGVNFSFDSDTTIGGTSSGDANIIAFNAGNGITIGQSATDDSTGDAILENSIFANSKLGVDLGDDGVTLNDSSGHSGPNLFQDFPVLSSASTSNGVTTISGSLSGAANTTYQLELFSNPSADPSGYGQGESFLMATSVTTDSSGHKSFTVNTASAVAVGQFVTATATDPVGDTSEFSADTVVTNTPTVPTLIPNSIAAVAPNPRNTPVSTARVTFNEPVNLGTFTRSALTLTDNGGSNLITSAVTINLVSGSTYQINGLGGLTSAEGNYILTVNAADIHDQSGNPGSGTVSTSWLMDTTRPTSTVNALPAQTTSTSVTVSVTGSDPSGSNGSAPSGVSSFAIYDARDNGAFSLWTTVTPASPSASFTGQAGNTYGFYSVATDKAGNVQATPAAAQATVQILSPLTAISITAFAPNPRNTPISTAQVTFNQPVNLTTFTSSALTLTDNGGSNLITSGVTASLVSGSTYQINGLSGLTTNNGNYTLTVDAADIDDTYGNPGSGTVKTSWLMDTTRPSSHVNPLPPRGTSLSFTVSVSGSDGGSPPSGLKSFDIYSSTNGGTWTLWTSVPASSPSATFTGQSNTTYSFYSIAHDLAGNVESKSPLIEASIYLPDLTPPVTSVDSATTASNPSSVNTSTGTFTLNLTGNDPGGALVTEFEVFVSIDGGAYTEVGPYAIPAGAADTKGNYHSTMIYQGLTDGTMHTYSFYSVGLDSAGNLQEAPSSPNVTFKETFAALTSPRQLQVTGFTVEHDSPSRSFVRYLDLTFNESDGQSGGALTTIVNSIATSSPDILIYKYDLNGDASTKTAVSLGSPTTLDVIDHAIEIDFGSGGLGNSPSTTAADGYYEVDIKLPSGQIAVHHFYRLFGDVDGDGIVDQNDLNQIAAEIGTTSPVGWTPLSADVTGAGSVTAIDLTLATRAKNHKLGAGLSLG
jgi:hypothetical protein